MKENESSKWLYNELVSNGYNVGKDYEEFDSLMTNNEESRKWAYDTARELGYNVGKDYEEFNTLVNPVVSGQPISIEPKNSTYSPYSVAPADYTQKTEAQKNYEERGDFEPKGQGTVNLNGLEVPVFIGDEGQFRVPSPVALDEQEEIFRHGNPSEAEQREEQERSYRNFVQSNRAKMDETDKRLSERMGEMTKQYFNDYKGVLQSDAMGEPAYMTALKGNRDYQNLRAAHNLIEDARKREKQVRRADDGFLTNTFRSMGETAIDERTWDLGARDMTDAISLYQAVQKDENGEELTESERILLDAFEGNALVMAQNKHRGESGGELAGAMTVEMIPFIAQIVANPLAKLGEATSKGAAKAISNWLYRRTKDMANKTARKAVRSAARGAVKFGAGLPADLAGGMGVAVTSNVMNTTADVYDRMLKGDSAGEAIAKGITSQGIEFASENAGRFFEPFFGGLGKVLGKGAEYGLNKVGAGSVVNLAKDYAKKAYTPAVKEFMDKTQWSGFLGEYGEELVGGVENALLVGDQTVSEVFSKDNLFDTAVGLSVASVLFPAIGTVNYGVEKGRQRKAVKEAEKIASGILKDRWPQFKAAINGAKNSDELGKAIEEIYKKEGKEYSDNKETQALFDYARSYYAYNALKGVDPNNVAYESELISAVRDNYQAGATMTAEELDNTRMDVNRIGVDLMRLTGMTEDELNDMDTAAVTQRINEAEENGDMDIADKWREFMNGSAAMSGKIKAVDDAINEQSAASDAEVDAITDGDGMIVLGTTRGGEQVYIIGGNVVLNGDNSVNKEGSSAQLTVVRDGKRTTMGIVELESVDAPIDAAGEKVSRRTAIEENLRRQQRIDMGEEHVFTPGEKFETLQGEVQFVADRGDGTADVTVNGNATVVDMGTLNEQFNTAKQMAYNARKAEETSQAQTVQADVPQPVNYEQVTSEVAQSALQRVPKDEQGEPIYEQVDSDTAWDAIVEQTEGDEAMAQTVADGMVADKEAALKKLEKAKSKGGATIAEKIAAEKERIAAIEAAKAELAKWKEIAGVAASRKAAPDINDASKTKTVATEGTKPTESVEVPAVEDVQPTNEMQPVEEHPTMAAAEEGRDTVGGSPVALAYLLEGGKGSILNAGYFLHGVAAAFPAITNEIEALRNAMSGDVLGMNPMDFATQRAEEIAAISELIEGTYGEEGLNVFSELLNNADGFYPRDGQEVAARIEALQPIEEHIGESTEMVGTVPSEAENGNENGNENLRPITAPAEVTDVETADEFVAGLLGGIKITPESFRKETGLGINEQRKLVGIIAGEEKGGDQDNAPYTIAPAQYTTKKGKVLDMHLVKFAGTLTKEQQRAAKELAKAEKGWYDREQGGFMMRSEESAKQLADTILNNDDAVSDAQPVSLADTRKVVETEQQVQPTNPSGNRLVTDERYAELRERMRKKLGGQMNIGIDPEILAIGTEMAVYHLEKGARKFTEYAKAMIADLGDAIRPYLKAFYNGARELPEIEEAGFTKDMTPYEEVKTFDVANFDKQAVDVMATAETVIREAEVAKDVEAVKAPKKRESAEGKKLRKATQEDLGGNPVVYYKGEKHSILMLVHRGEQTSGARFTKPEITRVYLENMQDVKVDDLYVEDTGENVGESGDKSVPSQQTPVNNLNENNDGREENTAANNSGAQPGREELPDTEQVGAGVPVQDTARNSKSKRRNAGLGSSKLGNGPQYDVNRNYTNEEIETIVSSVTDIVDGKVVITGEVTDDIKAIVRGYESGGIAKKGRGILDEYYTDGKIVDAVNLLIAPYFSSSTPIRVLEPSVGIGNFIQAVNNIPTSEVIAFEINETTARIAKILYPDVDVNLRSFETEFIDESGNKKPMPQKYSLVIGNPPYGSHRGLYKGLGEESKIARYEDYFVKRSLDVLDEGGVLAMVLPSSWMDRHTKFGGYTIERAYRLPSGAFEATQVGTDIVILKKDSSAPVTEHAPYFEQFPERVLGEVKQRKGRYGRLEEYVEGDIDAAIEAIKKENAEQVADLLDIEKNNDALNDIESAVDETGSPEKAVAIVKDAQESEKADKKPAKKPSGKQGKYKVELNRGVETVPTSAQFTHEFSEGEVEAFADTDYEGALSNPAKHRRYANYIGGQAIHDFYYAEGDIYSKLAQLEQEKDYIVENYGVEQYEKQKALLESVLPKQKSLEEITISPNTTFVKNLNILTEGSRVSLKDMFVDFLRKLPRQAFGNSSSWEVVGYINNEQVHGTDKQRNQLIRERRKRVANDLFNKFLSEELSDNAKKQVVAAFNREYNSTYRPDYSKVPMFSTINRDFKGKPLKLTSVQLAGIGRMTVKGVGVLAHEVGFGKTLSGILAMHEAMTRGFAKKPLIVVPNDNILKQWVETIGEALPNATINVLGNLGTGYDLTDFKINDGEFTIITYEGLKAMSFSDGTYEHLASKFSYITEDLNKHQSERDIQKRIEKTKEQKGKMKRGTKSSYMFEDFGFDWLTVDEVHNANHIVSKVRLDKSVASDFRSQSQRTSDLGLKTWLAAQYIQEENNGRNVLLLSATPFTNKPLEYYSILSLVGNDMLERKGFFNVDQFFATFMEADNELEIGANGRPTQKTNVRRFRNNGLFQQLLSEFIDIKGEEDNPELVRPERLNKEYKIAQNELTTEAMAAAQELLSDNDTVLQGIGHARAAVFSPYATSLLGMQPKNHKEFVKNSPKIDATIRMIEQNIKDRPDAGQIIYSEVGVEYFPLIRDYLVKESGLKPSEVRIITGATSNNERVNIQTAFNNGEVKVVIGSPAIKEGLNLQGNTTDMYMLSLPWNFTQLRQIEGRGWRQGNRWENIRINYMLTNDSVDVFMLQRLQLKQGLYNEAIKSGAESLDVSDIDTAELKTALITDPAVRAEIVTVQERAKLQQEKTQIEADLSFVMRKYEAYNKLVEKLENAKRTIKMYREWAQRGEEYWAQRAEREEAQLPSFENEIEEEKQNLLKKGVNVDDIVRQTEQAQNAIAAIQEKIDNLKEYQEELTQKFREESEAKAKEQGDLVSTYIKERKAENKGGFYKIRPQETETKAAEQEAKYAEMDANVEAANDLATAEEDINFRSGEGAYSDEEVAVENDPVSKVLGKPRFTRKLRREFAERERKRMRKAVDDVASALNTPIEVLESTEGLTGRRATAKGWYEKSTGKIVVVLPNNRSVADVMQTVLHEAVAHHGLRKLFGSGFDNFIENIYNNVDAETRQKINLLASRNGWNLKVTTEEYLASLAEDANFERVNPSLWQRIKSFFLDMLAEAGVRLDIELSDNELRYILWRSYQNLKYPGKYRTIADEARDIAKQGELKVGNYADNDTADVNVAEDDALFRSDSELAIENYNRRVLESSYQAQEALQDSMLALKEAQEAIVKETGKAIRDEENAYMAENALSSVNTAEAAEYKRAFYQPLTDELAKVGKKMGYEATYDYLMAKHGIERNREMSVKEALKVKGVVDKAKYESWKSERNDTIADAKNNGLSWEETQRKLDALAGNYGATIRDYSGLSSIYGDNFAEKAYSAVRDFENNVDTKALWARIKAANNATLMKLYNSSILDEETFAQISGMYEYYIPLRGFDEKIAEDVYAYVAQDTGRMGSVMKITRGRNSKAENPIAFIGQMAEQAITQGNRNRVKLRFLNFALSHMTSLLTVTRNVYLRREGEDWVVVTPKEAIDKLNNPTPDQIAEAVQKWQEDMNEKVKESPKDFKKVDAREGIPYKMPNKDLLSEHQVIVKRAGKMFVITVNGSPRLAQALNGLTNPDQGTGIKLIDEKANAINRINRMLSNVYTTKNINFVASNFVRDIVYTNSMVWVKESPKYAMKFHKNCLKYNPAYMMRLFSKLENGTLDMSNEDEKLFMEFYKNGGETGYTQIKDIEAKKKELKKMLAKADRKGLSGIISDPLGKGKDGFEAIGDFLDYVNRSVENVARFAAYKTSREMGRSVSKSIWDAKEISVNFNKTGAGGKFYKANGQTLLGSIAAAVSGTGRGTYVFWNASVQGMYNFAKNAKENPTKALGMAASVFALGVLVSMFAGDDDEYMQLPEYIRRSNICFKFPWMEKDSWVTIPLPIEYRALYGAGEYLTNICTGKEEFEALKAGELISQLLPIDVLEGGGGLNAFMPTLVKPIWSAYIVNESWTGLPVWKDSPFDTENVPQYKRVYRNTSPALVSFTKMLNQFSGGDEHKAGWIDINPAKIEHVLEGYFGGYATMARQAINLGSGILGDEDYSFDPKDVPIASRVWKYADKERGSSGVKNKFYEYKKNHEVVKAQLKGYAKDAVDPKRTEEDRRYSAERVKEIQKSDAFKAMQVYEAFGKALDNARKMVKEDDTKENRRREAMLMEQVNKEIEKVLSE